MGTLFRIKLYAETEAQAQAAFRSAFGRVAQIDNILSDYKPDSELNGLTTNAVERAVPVSPDLFRVLHAAQAISAESDGAFDVTLGPLTHLWRIARKTGRVPEPEAVRSAASECGFRKMHLDSLRHTVAFDQAGMQLDVGGIGKGFAADEALGTIRRLGIPQALVAASGDLAFGDAPPGKAGWSIGMDSLDDAGQPFTKVLVLKNAAVSTSGDTEQHLDSRRQRFSHVLDPRTGMGLTNQLTVTIVASSGIEADALTKVVSVWGREKGLAFIAQRPGVKVLIADRAATPTVVSTSGGLN